jgi:hypothetical protein
MVFIICLGLIPPNVISDEDYYDKSEINGIMFSMDQVVDGHGFSSEMENIRHGPVAAKNLNYGSGHYKKEMNQYSQRDVSFYNRSGEYLASSLKKIKTSKNIEMVFSESNLSIPGSFRTEPFHSLLTESDSINQNSYGFSMGLVIDNARSIKKNLITEVTGSAQDDSYMSDSSSFDASVKSDLDLSFIGNARIFQAVRSPGEKGRLIDNLSRDELYIGQMNISQKGELSIDSSSKSPKIEVDAMPCCNDDYFVLPKESEAYQAYLDTNDVFNCSCQSEL